MATSSKKILQYIKPMLATAVDQPFNSKEWLFELKLDGYRAITEIKKRKILLYSRNGLLLGTRYPSIINALEKINIEAILDGEIVVLDDNGKPDFQKLQNYQVSDQYPLVYYVFDILFLQKNDLKKMPLLERKKILKKIFKRPGVVRYCDHIENDGIDFFKKVIAASLEGIMAKKKDSLYTPGIRTREWLKIKYHKSQEAIIAGFTEPKGSRQHLGSLLLAQYKNGKLRYIGHAGTGFTDKTLNDLMKKLKPLVTAGSPFDIPVKANGPVTWVKPVLVCEVAYYEITQDGIMRHPVFKRLRPEKKAKGIKMETERSLPVKKVIRSLKYAT